MTKKPEENLALKKHRIKRMYKVDLKRYGIYLLILLPILLGFAMLFAHLNLKNGLSIALVAVVGIVFIALFELIYYVRSAKVEEKQKGQPKKKDPFAD